MADASDIDIVVNASRKLEICLREKYRAEGRGLSELAESMSHVLPSGLIQDLKWIAGVRNSVVHKDGSLHSREKFVSRAQEAADDLVKLGEYIEGRLAPLNEEKSEQSAATVHAHLHRVTAIDDQGDLAFVMQCRVQNGMSKQLTVFAGFFDVDGENVIGCSKEFTMPSGQLRATETMEPSSNDEFFSHFTIWMPAVELCRVFDSGVLHNVLIKIAIVHKDIVLARSKYIKLCFKCGSDSVRVTEATTARAEKITAP